jgi:hypothetical protein
MARPAAGAAVGGGVGLAAGHAVDSVGAGRVRRDSQAVTSSAVSQAVPAMGTCPSSPAAIAASITAGGSPIAAAASAGA